jgi:hypothetical protein
MGTRTIGQGSMNYPSIEHLAVTPTKPVKEGTFEFSSRWQLAAPKLSAHLDGSSEPLTMSLLHSSPEMNGKYHWPLVDGGTGSAEELSRLKLRGKAVVVSPPDIGYWGDRAEAAGAAGAAAVVIVGAKDEPVWQAWSPDGERYPLPAMAIANDNAQKLLSKVRSGKAGLDLTGTMAGPYHYDVMQVSGGRIPEHVVHEVTDGNTARVDTSYQQSGGFGWAKEQRFGWRPWQEYGLGNQMELQRIVRTPLERAEYVSSGDTQWQHVVQHLFTWDSFFSLRGGLTDLPQSYKADQAVRERWFGPVVRPAIPDGVPALIPRRTGDALTIQVPEFVDSSGTAATRGSRPSRRSTTTCPPI